MRLQLWLLPLLMKPDYIWQWEKQNIIFAWLKKTRELCVLQNETVLRHFLPEWHQRTVQKTKTETKKNILRFFRETTSRWKNYEKSRVEKIDSSKVFFGKSPPVEITIQSKRWLCWTTTPTWWTPPTCWATTTGRPPPSTTPVWSQTPPTPPGPPATCGSKPGSSSPQTPPTKAPASAPGTSARHRPTLTPPPPARTPPPTAATSAPRCNSDPTTTGDITTVARFRARRWSDTWTQVQRATPPWTWRPAAR